MIEWMVFAAFLVFVGAVVFTAYMVCEFTLAIFHVRLEILMMQLQQEGVLKKEEDKPGLPRFGFSAVEIREVEPGDD